MSKHKNYPGMWNLYSWNRTTLTSDPNHWIVKMYGKPDREFSIHFSKHANNKTWFFSVAFNYTYFHISKDTLRNVAINRAVKKQAMKELVEGDN